MYTDEHRLLERDRNLLSYGREYRRCHPERARISGTRITSGAVLTYVSALRLARINCMIVHPNE
jgi:hypothetical protein